MYGKSNQSTLTGRGVDVNHVIANSLKQNSGKKPPLRDPTLPTRVRGSLRIFNGRCMDELDDPILAAEIAVGVQHFMAAEVAAEKRTSQVVVRAGTSATVYASGNTGVEITVDVGDLVVLTLRENDAGGGDVIIAKRAGVELDIGCVGWGELVFDAAVQDVAICEQCKVKAADVGGVLCTICKPLAPPPPPATRKCTSRNCNNTVQADVSSDKCDDCLRKRRDRNAGLNMMAWREALAASLRGLREVAQMSTTMKAELLTELSKAHPASGIEGTKDISMVAFKEACESVGLDGTARPNTHTPTHPHEPTPTHPPTNPQTPRPTDTHTHTQTHTHSHTHTHAH